MNPIFKPTEMKKNPYIDSITPAIDQDCYRAPGTPHSTIISLSKGEKKITQTLNLRGMLSEEALDLMLNTIDHHYHSGCILVIHGQGHRSQHQAPIIKNLIWDYVPKNTRVIGMSTASAKDGGLGASYILLKKTKR